MEHNCSILHVFPQGPLAFSQSNSITFSLFVLLHRSVTCCSMLIVDGRKRKRQRMNKIDKAPKDEHGWLVGVRTWWKTFEKVKKSLNSLILLIFLNRTEQMAVFSLIIRKINLPVGTACQSFLCFRLTRNASRSHLPLL